MADADLSGSYRGDLIPWVAAGDGDNPVKKHDHELLRLNGLPATP